MITLISYFILLLGAFNWFSIGLMQYDFIAGIFGTQSSFLSRAIYIVVGFAGVWFIITTFLQKGKIKINENGFKRSTAKKLAEPAPIPVEADKDYAERQNYDNRQEYQESQQTFNNQNNNNYNTNNKSPFEK